ncbi:MAG: RNA methyltransferase [Candidatus Accumulibacter sp.]|jgi:23S rRNA (adenine2503-C2)-methyltransferase|nr:RNA methyltransferase [Accumulibacter sp.]
MQIFQLRERLRELGAKPCHAQRVLRAWLRGQPLDAGGRRQRAADFLPLSLRDALPRLTDDLDRLARLRSTHVDIDHADAARLLLILNDGQTVESVLLPRDGVCVSTQVGCAVGCLFCMTGQGGLSRQLGSAEIVAQVVLARRLRQVKKVVFMGMGEPAHNLDNVLDAIDLLGGEGGVAHKNLVFSSVGDYRMFERLPRGRVKPALALSLHTTDPELRVRLLPKAPRVTPDELIALGERYARATGYPIQYQWTLLDGINDSDAEINRLAALLGGKYAMLNFISFNAVEGAGFRRVALGRALALVGQLRQRGIVACLRDSVGQAVDGGCGQLRSRDTV